MTRNADWNYVKPMGLIVSIVMMVVLCLVTTRTFQGIGTGQFAATDGMSDSFASLKFMKN